MTVKIRNRADAELVLEEARRRRIARDDLLEAAFKNQRDFILDGCKLKAALCTRRAGKSYTMGLYIFREALRNPGCSILYLGLSYQAAKRIIVKDIFMQIARQFGIALKVNYSDLSMKFPNGSMVYISGADSNEKAHAKLLGQKYRLAVIDEAAEWKTDLINLVYTTLRPAMIDNDGTICLAGVPGNIQGFFYDITTQAKDPVTNKVIFPGWSIHKWTAFDNPHIAEKWRKEVEDILKENPSFADSPIYKQQYLGQWCMDPDAQCYRFEDDRNRIAELPMPPSEYNYMLGVDLGWADPTAFVVVAYRKDAAEGVLYVVNTYKQEHMLPDDIAAKVHELEADYPISRYIIDAANKQLVQDLVQRLGIPFEPATKGNTATRKRDYIHMCSTDLMTKKIMVVGNGCEELVEEWKKLVWDKSDRYNPREHQSCDNHCADAFLYAWNECYAFNHVPPEKKSEGEPNPFSPDWATYWERRLQRKYEQKQDDLAALDRLLD